MTHKEKNLYYKKKNAHHTIFGTLINLFLTLFRLEISRPHEIIHFATVSHVTESIQICKYLDK